MTDFSQDNRLLKIHSPLPEGAVLLTAFKGEEAISALPRYTLDLVSRAPIEVKKLQTSLVTVEINTAEHPRFFNGYITELKYLDGDDQSLYHYQAQMNPWLWFLDQVSDCRIFHHQNIVQIAETLFQEFGFSDYEFRCMHLYEKHSHLTQYDETAFHFLSRLFEEAGIFYDDQSDYSPDPILVTFDPTTSLPNSITQWKHSYQAKNTKVSGRDHHPELMRGFIEAQAGCALINAKDVFCYPDDYENYLAGTHRARVLSEAERAQTNTVLGKSHLPDFSPGAVFRLCEHPLDSECGDYVLTEVIHTAEDQTHLSQDDHPVSFYKNQFKGLPTRFTCYALRKTPKPCIVGVQTAVVIGPEDETVYTNERGEIKVQFHWEHRKTGSDWVRVKQKLAGDHWGTQFLPKIGDEVGITFIHGDPDKPVVIGSFYHGKNKPPFDTDYGYTQGIKTECGHELSFHDELGEEKVTLHSAKDLKQEIGGDKITEVGHHSSTTIQQGNRSVKIKGSLTIEAKEMIILQSGTSTIKIEPTKITVSGPIVGLNSPNAEKVMDRAVAEAPADIFQMEEVLDPAKPHWFFLYYTPKAQMPADRIAYRLNFTDKTEHTGQIQAEGYSRIPESTEKIPESLYVPGAELLKVGKTSLPFPGDFAQTSPADLAVVTQTFSGKKAPQKKDVMLKAETLYPMTILNLRQDGPNARNPRPMLLPRDIEYFQKNGNNVTLFIHGYNIALGHFPKQIRDIQVKPKTQIINQQMQIYQQASLSHSSSNRSLYLDRHLLEQRFPQLKQCFYHLPHELATPDGLNGTEAINWFIHMEDNLNRATGQFNRSDYSTFTRLLHVAWSGDVPHSWDYADAEETANEAGHKLRFAIEQLKQAGLTINIIAHSLGSRVLLTIMNDLGKFVGNDIIDHVFLWEAAVPQTALSNDPTKDTTIKYNGHFVHAYKAAKKITVLYSNQDFILGVIYWLANYIGITPGEFFSPKGEAIIRAHFHGSLLPCLLRLYHLVRDSKFHLFVTDTIDSETHARYAANLRQVAVEAELALAQKYHVLPALGYNGPE